MSVKELIVGVTDRQKCAFFFDFLPDGTPQDAVFCDASITETHSRAADLTSSPIETGGSINDHRRRQPNRVTINGLLSNQELDPFAAVADLAASVGDAFSTPAADAIFGGKRAGENWRKLCEVYKAEKNDPATGEPDPKAGLFSLQTETEVYPSMVFVSLELGRAADNGDSLFFTAVCQEVIFASSETVAVVVEDVGPDGNPSRGGTAERGGVSASAASEDLSAGVLDDLSGLGQEFYQKGRAAVKGAADAAVGFIAP